MQIAALNNPAAAKMVSAAAKPPAPASGDFSSALATAIASVSPEGRAPGSGTNAAAQTKQTSEPACDAKSFPLPTLELAGISAVNADPNFPAATDPQPVRKPDSKTEADRKQKPDHAAGNSRPVVSAATCAQSSHPPAPLPVPALAESAIAAANAIPGTAGDTISDTLASVPAMGSLPNTSNTSATTAAAIPQETNIHAPQAAVVSEDFGEATAKIGADLVQETDSSPTVADWAPTDRPVANNPVGKTTLTEVASQLGNTRSTEVLFQPGVPMTPTVETPSAPSPWSVPATIAVITTTKIPEADASQAASIEPRFAPPLPTDLSSTPNLLVHPENRYDETNLPLPPTACVISLKALVPQTHPNAFAGGNPSPTANAQEAVVLPRVQQPDQSTGSSTARSPAPSPQNPVPIAAPSPHVDKPSAPISSASDRTLLDARAARQFQMPNQELVPATNVAANIPASLAPNIPSSITNLVTNNRADTPSSAEAAPDPKQLLDPPASTQKKSPAPESRDAMASSAASHIVAPDTGVTTPAPAPADPVAPQATSQIKAEQTPELPKTQQMLDSLPPAPQPPSNAASTPTQPADLQMHVGIRTTAFGAVEIHTTVVQNQVGIAVHGDRSLAQWFSSEVPGLESGLKDHSMNLAAIHFDNGRSGVQTATSFHHRSPQHNLWQAAAGPSGFEDSQAAPEAGRSDSLLPDLSIRPAGTRVSILV